MERGCAALERISFDCGRLWKRLFAYQFIVTAHAGGGGLSERRPKVVVVMPAYNAERTLHMTYAALPHDVVDLVIVVDDGSRDETARLARELGSSSSCTTATTATARTRRPAIARR